jgi:hypothetical protein
MAIHTDNRTHVLTDFVTRLKEAKKETPLTVFICGPAVFNRNGKRSRRHGARIRDFVSKKIAEGGSEVFWGEHRVFKGVGKHVTLKRFTDADNEVHFAEKSADLILIFPDSAGSLAELGAFSLHNGIAINMVIVFDARRRSDTGFVVKAIARAAKTRKAQITFQDYRRPGDVWRFVERVVSRLQTIKLTSKSYAEL